MHTYMTFNISLPHYYTQKKHERGLVIPSITGLSFLSSHNLIRPYYWRKPSVFKLLQLFNITNVKELCNLGKYICRALKLRADTL